MRQRSADFDTGPEEVADLELMASELVTNAIQHGLGGSVLITLDCRDGTVILKVDSVGPSRAVGPTPTWLVAEASAVSGRGLGLVRELADDIDVDQRPDRLSITVHRHLRAG